MVPGRSERAGARNATWNLHTEQGRGKHLEGAVDVVVTVKQNLGLHNGDQASVLADGGIAGQAVGGFGHSMRRGACRNVHHCAPLSKAGALHNERTRQLEGENNISCTKTGIRSACDDSFTLRADIVQSTPFLMMSTAHKHAAKLQFHDATTRLATGDMCKHYR